jgi:cytochrome c553
MTRLGWIVLCATLAGSTLAGAAPGGDASQAEAAFFESKVRPILSTHCYSCHSAQAQKVKGGLLLDSREALLKGGDSGPAILPGQPDKSRLIQAVRWASKDLQMPQKAKLPDAAISDLAAWVKSGAPWPKNAVAPAAAPGSGAAYERLRREHWAWQPVRKAAPGADIDRFILAKLDEAGLKPVAPADRVSMLRRVSFDLTGLPPTPEEIQGFVADSSADAFEKVVDRLLASRGFGERWARHWLDVVRYAESTGSARNVAYPHAWRYRDYVIASFNADKPYDRFVREQIAGDLLPSSTPEQRDELLIATGFLALGTKDLNEKNSEQYLMDCIDDQIDVTSRAILALTASCARCHDHKFDPIPTTDYYALAGIFKSTIELAGVKNRGKGGGKDYTADGLLLTLGSKTATVAAPPEPAEGKKARKGKKVKAEEPAEQAAGESLAMGVREGAPVEAKICIRGEVDHLGATVARGVPTLFRLPQPVTVDAKSSGRLPLASWLASPANPLTARVMANRVWSHLFGEGIVATVDNFGTTGEAPSHPALLDHLAASFVEQGWSVKKLVRNIVLSRAYQRGGEARAENIAVDPADRLLWRSSPRRLDAESLRDAILAVSGQLDPAPLAGSPVATLSGQLSNKGGRGFEAEETRHRSVYLPIVRDAVPDFLHVFDFADPSSIIGHRDVTTVATQALLLMNNSFVTGQARLWAEKLLSEKASDDAAQIESAYRRALGRAPTAEERDRVLKYLGPRPDKAAWAGFCQALFESAEFRYLGLPAPGVKETSHVR